MKPDEERFRRILAALAAEMQTAQANAQAAA